MALAIGLFLGSAGFWVGRTVSPLPMAIGFLATAVVAWVCSWRRALLFLVLCGVLLLMTMYSFSYTGTDAGIYHIPMQRLLLHGWNPVFDSSLEQLKAVAPEGGFSYNHTLFLPRLTALCGALMASLTGLFVADAFLGYALIFALLVVSYRFARTMWNTSVGGGILFSLAITFSSKITSFLAGQIDFTSYAALMLGIFSFLTWRKREVLVDLLLAALGMAFAILAKSTGLLCGMIFCFIALCSAWRNVSFLRVLFGLALFVLVVGASPLLTNWIHYGSPVYPSMTFHPTIQPVDITWDFTGNDDALQMGYLARIVYAWVSKPLAIHGCAWWYDNPNFNPQFMVPGGVGGMGTFFCLLLMGACVALLCSRVTIVTWLCILLFITSNFAPLKYIGYNRYFPQIWAIPFLAAFNFFYAPRAFLTRWMKWLRPLGMVAIGCIVALFMWRTVAYQGHQWRFERERQQELAQAQAESSVWASSESRYVHKERIRMAGIQLSDDPSAPQLGVHRRLLLFGPTAEADALRIEEAFPICDTVRALMKFPYVKAFWPVPHPVFDRSQDTSSTEE